LPVLEGCWAATGDDEGFFRRLSADAADRRYESRTTEGTCVTGTANHRVAVLCVDDEPKVLEGIATNLRRKFEVLTAGGGAEGLRTLEANPQIVAVLSDMRMPRMDGAAFLEQARHARPDAVRMLLTGHVDVGAAVLAVNQGQIFRFLIKPCPTPELVDAFERAVEQHRLITAERVLLEQTLRGSVKMLTDLLSLANPAAFGRATRMKTQAVELAKRAGLKQIWQIEVAAMLSQIACITLPAATVEKLYYGQPLSAEERLMADRLPAVADDLLGNIPRLEEVRACLAHRVAAFDGGLGSPSGLRGEAIPIGARILRIVSDFEALEAQGSSVSLALDTMRGRTGAYDPALLEAFATLRGSATLHEQVREIPLRMVTAGMTFLDDVKAPSGGLLLARGYEVTEALVERVRNFAVRGNVRVALPSGRGA
jgi:response regulator RpfG family c-di-GMP phosphodiesterase